MYVIPYRDMEHSQGGKTTLMKDKQKKANKGKATKRHKEYFTREIRRIQEDNTKGGEEKIRKKTEQNKTQIVRKTDKTYIIISG